MPVAESKEFPRQKLKVAGAAIAGFRKLMISLGIGDLRLETELWFWFLWQGEPFLVPPFCECWPASKALIPQYISVEDDRTRTAVPVCWRPSRRFGLVAELPRAKLDPPNAGKRSRPNERRAASIPGS